MTTSYLRLNRIAYTGPQQLSEFSFRSGNNVICGASDTGKSFLAESIDYMLGGSKLREIPERTQYDKIQLDLEVDSAETWRFHRATQGGNFRAVNLSEGGTQEQILRQKHGHDKTDNISGFLLDIIGLNGKRILRSKNKGTTQSLSFRNLARLIIVQEGEIQQTGSRSGADNTHRKRLKWRLSSSSLLLWMIPLLFRLSRWRGTELQGSR